MKEMVALDPKTGLRLRKATRKEVVAYRLANLRTGSHSNSSFDRPVKVGKVLIDEETEAIGNFIPMRFRK